MYFGKKLFILLVFAKLVAYEESDWNGMTTTTAAREELLNPKYLQKYKQKSQIREGGGRDEKSHPELTPAATFTLQGCHPRQRVH